MKKKILVVLFMNLFLINVYADIELPKVIKYKAMITNQSGAICYDENKEKKDDLVVPYKTVFNVQYDVYKGLIYVNNDDYECYVKQDDLGAMDKEFNIDNKEVVKIDDTLAIVLSSSGINLRKGPATSFRKIVTVPENTIVTLKYRAGTYWYFVEYGNNSGWVTAMNQYLGYEDDLVLVNNNIINIYDSKKNIVGRIPANTEISSYLQLTTYTNDDPLYYVIYNGVKGYIKEEMLYKTNGTGKIKLIKDVDILDKHGNPEKKILANQELTYTMRTKDNGFYLDEKEVILNLSSDQFEYIQEAKLKIKESGYIGEGIFGEEKEDIPRNHEKQEPNNEIIEEKEKNDFNIKEVIIIGLLVGIFITLVILIVLKLSNRNKNNINNINL